MAWGEGDRTGSESKFWCVTFSAGPTISELSKLGFGVTPWRTSPGRRGGYIPCCCSHRGVESRSESLASLEDGRRQQREDGAEEERSRSGWAEERQEGTVSEEKGHDCQRRKGGQE